MQRPRKAPSGKRISPVCSTRVWCNLARGIGIPAWRPASIPLFGLRTSNDDSEQELTLREAAGAAAVDYDSRPYGRASLATSAKSEQE